jgi:hypothetical protein
MVGKLNRVIAGLLFLIASGEKVFGCPECRLRVRGEIFGQNFLPTLSLVLLPVVVILVIGIGLFYAGEIKKGVSR